MTVGSFHAVFLHSGAIEALGAAISPYLSDGPHGKHVVCRDIDPGGPFFGMTIAGTTSDGKSVDLELMIPANMVLMVLSAHGEGSFGFQQGPTSADAGLARQGNTTSGSGHAPAATARAPEPPAISDPLSSLEG